MSFRQAVQYRFVGMRIGSWVMFAGLGALALGSLAWGDGASWKLPSLFGATCAALFAILRYPLTGLIDSIEPTSDEDGLVRTALSLDENDPGAEDLILTAKSRAWRLRSLSELPSFAFIAAISVAVALWNQAAPTEVMLKDSATLSSGLTSGSPALQGDVTVAKKQPTTSKSSPTAGDASEANHESTAIVQIDFAIGNHLGPNSAMKLGNNFGLTSSTIERYWRLRAQESE